MEKRLGMAHLKKDLLKRAPGPSQNALRCTIHLQLDASLMSCLLCLLTVSVFLHVNFLVKLATMLVAGAAHLTIYTCFLAEPGALAANNITISEKLVLGNAG